MASKIKHVGDEDYDILIGTSDGGLIKGHSDILTKVSTLFEEEYEPSELFDNKKCLEYYEFDFSNYVVHNVLTTLYSIYYDSNISLVPRSNDRENIDKLIFINILKIKIDIQNYKQKLVSKIIEYYADSWLELVECYYNVEAAKEIINLFFKRYSEGDPSLKLLSSKDLSEIEDKNLVTKLVSLMLQRNRLEATNKIN